MKMKVFYNFLKYKPREVWVPLLYDQIHTSHNDTSEDFKRGISKQLKHDTEVGK